MSLLSKSEIQFFLGKKHVPKSYEYKLKSIIKKVFNLVDKETSLITTLFSNLNNLTEISKPYTKILDNFVNLSSKFDIKEKTIFKPKFYINKNNKDMKGSGGVEVFNTNNLKDCIVRLSISPSQGDDPGFKSRPEHIIQLRIITIK